MFDRTVFELKEQIHDALQGHRWVDWVLSSTVDLLTGPLTGLRTRTYWPDVVAALLIAGIVFMIRDRAPGDGLKGFLRYCFPKRMFWHRSTWVDCQLIVVNNFVTPLINVTWRLGTPLFTGLLLTGLIKVFGPPARLFTWSPASVVVLTILAALGEDFGYYLFHLLAHRNRWLWAFHRVHHSAETLQVFANVRVHPVEVLLDGPFRNAGMSLVLAPALYLGPGDAPFATILGMNLMAAFYGAVGSQLHHCHLWISWGPKLEHILISPVLHQIHHSTERRHWNRNMGGNFALWDWMFGTLYVPQGREELTFGLGGGTEQPHPTLFAAYFEPFWSLMPMKDRIQTSAQRLFPSLKLMPPGTGVPH